MVVCSQPRMEARRPSETIPTPRRRADARCAGGRRAMARSRSWRASRRRAAASVHSPLMSPLVWDLGHIAAYEDLWLAQRHGGMRAAAAGARRPSMTLLRRLEPCGVRSSCSTAGRHATTCAAVRERTAEVLRERRRRRRGDLRDGAAPRAAAHRDDAPDARDRRTAARRRADHRPAARRCGAPWRSGSRSRQRRSIDGRRTSEASPTTTSVRVTPSTWPPFRSPASR